MTSADTSSGSPLWRFSLGFYRRAGVAEACLALQDGDGVDVNLLLFLLWLAASRRCVTPAAARAAWARTERWREDVVKPLRALRRRLKEGSDLVHAGDAEALRTRIKAVELESERLQQEALFALAGGLETGEAPTVEAAARASLAACEDAAGRTFDAAQVDRLLAALAAGPG